MTMTAAERAMSSTAAWGLSPELDMEAWKLRGLCAQTDPEAFFPEKGGSSREAKRICVGCEVREECLGYAIENDERFGVWGGLSERERRRLSRGEAVSVNVVERPDRKPNGHARACACWECRHGDHVR